MRIFEITFNMSFKYVGSRKISVKYFPTYGTMEVKYHDDDCRPGWRFADYWLREEIMKHPKFKEGFSKWIK